MLPVWAISIIGIFVDPRIITGAPAWMKPAKFAGSIAIYTLTLAWIFQYLPDWQQLRQWTGWVTAVTMVIEITVITLQAARGTASHFNIGTVFDANLYRIMGTAIAIAWVASIAVAFALFQQKFDDPIMGWALRIGTLITVFGAATGGLMTTPTSAQLAEARATHHMTMVGAHTVGAPDGGPGIPIAGWSKKHGDLRVPHFIGLHAMQFLPLLALLWKPERASSIIVAGSAYALIFILTLAISLAGRPITGGVQ